MGLEAAWCASSPAPRVHGKSASDGSGCAGALVQCRGMRLLITRIAASPTSTPNNGKAPRYAKSRRGPSAQTGQGQKERHLVSVYPRASFLWRKVSLQIDIAPSGCCAIRRNRKPQSRGRDSDPSSIKSTLSLRAIRRRGQYHPRGDEHFEGSTSM